MIYPDTCPVLLESNNGRKQILMPEIPGKTILEMMNNGELAKLTIDQRMEITIAITEALDDFHKKGYVHGDISPANIKYDAKSKKAYLLDFGATKPTHEKKKEPSGTRGYMAPEVSINAMSREPVDNTLKSDVYGLGVLTYQIMYNTRESNFSLNTLTNLNPSDPNKKQPVYKLVSLIATMKTIKHESRPNTNDVLVSLKNIQEIENDVTKKIIKSSNELNHESKIDLINLTATMNGHQDRRIRNRVYDIENLMNELNKQQTFSPGEIKLISAVAQLSNDILWMENAKDDLGDDSLLLAVVARRKELENHLKTMKTTFSLSKYVSLFTSIAMPVTCRHTIQRDFILRELKDEIKDSRTKIFYTDKREALKELYDLLKYSGKKLTATEIIELWKKIKHPSPKNEFLKCSNAEIVGAFRFFKKKTSATEDFINRLTKHAEELENPKPTIRNATSGKIRYN